MSLAEKINIDVKNALKASAYESSTNVQESELKNLLVYISVLAAFLLGLVFFVYNQIIKTIVKQKKKLRSI